MQFEGCLEESVRKKMSELMQEINHDNRFLTNRKLKNQTHPEN